MSDVQAPKRRETREVPLDLCRDTVHLIARLPLGDIYLLARRWEDVCPEFFTGLPPAEPNGDRP